MSADLFAEFGAESDPTQQTQQSLQAPVRPSVQQSSSFSFFDGWSATAAAAPASQQPSQSPLANSWNNDSSPAPKAVEDDSDDWGDFEGGSSFAPAAPAAPAQVDPFAAVVSPASPPTKHSWSITPATDDNFISSFGQHVQADQSSWQRAPIVKAKKSADPSVLFDAEDDQDDDDFGDFEGTEDTKPAHGTFTAPSSALADLLGDLTISPPTAPVTNESYNIHSPQHSRSSFTAKRSPLSIASTATKPQKPLVAVSAKKEEDDAGWDTFDDWEQSIPGTVTAKEPTKSKASTLTQTTPQATTPKPILSPVTDDAQPGELPPTNVPPPGVLLSLFPLLFNEAQEKLFKPMAAQTLPMRNKLMAEPATIAYLAGYLVLANVAAHIIAGRKLRWKRDQHLSQGMRIGPASSRATSGMKLTGIDKGENMKEEREVSDVVRVWKEQVGRLRHVVSGANQIKSGTLGSVPDLQEVMPLRTLKQSEGGMPARQPCMLCGLKREERVTAADLATDDSFGEWWIDQVNMHRGKCGGGGGGEVMIDATMTDTFPGCRNFWNEHKDRLRQR
ncbi:hypothetical protein T440DRAFT_254413 [Plenodomus tracheiphilus IPT5]|uniref:Uncharacterized protein n=1 Tax=Plenodomus tracheiphilus IPT5 TaxID=1408161 RepID=A0A6A7AUN6_9PLEO|nr:hypothetical protein T440DRAFT_254413 [Plenodomus tracheiphilus IPT5]